MAEQAAQEPAAPAPDSPAPPQPSKSKTWPLLLFGLLIMVVTPLATWLVVRATVEKPFVSSSSDAKPQAPVVLSLGPIYVNIAATKGTRILKIEPHLVLSEDRLRDDLTRLQPMLRDKVMTVAAAKTLDELERPESREALKQEIVASANDLIRNWMSGSVLDVVFNEFLVQ